MSSIVSPASSTARRIASTVSDTGGTMSLRPIRDMPMPVTRDAVLELVERAPSAAPTGCVRARRCSSGQRRRRLAGRFEQRDPHVVDGLEHDADPHADLHRLGLAADDVRGEPDARVLVDRDDGHDERRRVVGRPLLHVRGVALHDAAPRHGLRRRARRRRTRGRPARAGAAARRTRRSAGTAAGRRRPTSSRSGSSRGAREACASSGSCSIGAEHRARARAVVARRPRRPARR